MLLGIILSNGAPASLYAFASLFVGILGVSISWLVAARGFKKEREKEKAEERKRTELEIRKINTKINEVERDILLLKDKFLSSMKKIEENNIELEMFKSYMNECLNKTNENIHIIETSYIKAIGEQNNLIQTKLDKLAEKLTDHLISVKK